MALSAKVGSFAAPAATGSKAVTGVGFQPKAILFWGGPQTADADNTVDWTFFLGIAVSSSSRAVVAATNRTAFDTEQATSSCIFLFTDTGTTALKADFTSMDADGFTVNFSTTTSGVVVNFLCLGGADLTNVGIKQVSAPASTGSQATTGVGFKPDAILTFTVGDTTAPDHHFVNHDCLGIGAGTASTARWATSNEWEGTNPSEYQRTNAVVALIDNGAKVVEADLTSLDSDGFTLNYSTTTSGVVIFVLCLKGGQFKAGSFNQPTSTGNKAVTGVGFTPAAELFASFMDPAATTIQTAANLGERLMVGAMSGASARGVAALMYPTTAPVQLLNRSTAIRLLNTSGTVGATADFVSHDSDGFTVNFTTADATAREILYLAFGSAAVVTDPFPLAYPNNRICFAL